MAVPVPINKSPAKTVLLRDDFADNRNNWEITDNESEYASIEEGSYVLEDRHDTRWTFYHLPTTLREKDNFEIRARMRVLRKRFNGQLGVVWGFDKAHEVLNKFSVTADLGRCTVMQFQKDHHRVYHRFQSLLDSNKTKDDIQLRIRLEKPYYQFWVNEELVYLAHEAHFAREGNRIGFYMEPGLKAAAKFLELSRLAQE